MRKLLSFCFIAIAGIVAANGAMAGIITPEVKANKSLVAHCGCNDTFDGLEWQWLEVSKNSKGHGQHNAGDEEYCFDGEVDQGPFERGANDCLIDGEDLAGVEDCDLPPEGDCEALPD